MPDLASILIGADICPIERNRPYFEQGDARSLFNDLLPELDQAGLVVANLECPLIKQPSPIFKTGPVFGESAACLNGIKHAGIDVLCLANNHILDHGAPGLRNTLEACAKAGIATVGAGENLAAARRILIRQVGTARVGILAMAEHEFSIAGKDSAGANPLDLIDFVRSVNRRRSDFDYLIVLLHGSAEFFVPTPRIQNTCRFLVEMGANAVIVQHPHVLGGYEHYRSGHIVYGQGALVMDEAIYRDRSSFHEGFLVKLTVEKTVDGGQRTEDGGRSTEGGGRKTEDETQHSTTPPLHRSSTPSATDSQLSDFSSQLSIIPFTQSNPEPGARRIQGEREAQFRRRLEERSRKILDESFVQEEWRRFCDQHKHGYIGSLLGFNRVMRKLNRGGFLVRLLCGKRSLLGVRNLVQCETHREAIETIFNRQLL